MEYRHSQFGTVLVIGLLTPMLAMFVVPMLLGSFPPVLFVVPVILLVSLALFYSLNVEITGGTLDCSFGIGVIRKKILLADIVEARAVDNPWLLGWGIRWMPGQYWAWNVSGLRAVELLLKDGSRFRVGTDDPKALVKAIELNKTSAT
jgi:hypothetical protein